MWFSCSSLKAAKPSGRRAVLEALESRCLLSGDMLNALASFDYTNGAVPLAALLVDIGGNLYGTTSSGGAYGHGTVFELSHGTSTITTLVSFDGTNGADPQAGLIVDSSGNLYGTTFNGGAHGQGTVFELAHGASTVTTLASFNVTNGQGPEASLAVDSDGNLYGTTLYGGNSNYYGTIFELPRGASTIDTLVSFNATNGDMPEGALVFDSSGNLFGTTSGDGNNGDGTIFELAAGKTTITTLAAFNGADGATPQAALVLDSSGNLFGTTAAGGAYGDGTVFRLAHGATSITSLASFNGTNGSVPQAALVLDSSGDLFGTSTGGGADSDGTLFELVHGSTTITALASFNGTDGAAPEAAVVFDANGNLYGTTSSGGAFGDGTLFEFGPASQLAFAAAPPGAVAGGALSPSVTVDIEDVNGNVIAGAASTVTLTIASGPSGAALGGTRSALAVNGVATFADLSLDEAGTYALEASDGRLTPATSAGFTIGLAPTSTSLQTSSATSTSGAAVTFTATVASTSAGAPAPTGNVTFFDGATQIGAAAVNSSGIAALTDAALSVGGHSISASYSGDGACAASTSANIAETVTPSPASRLEFATPAFTVTAGAILSPLTIDVDDSKGSLVAGDASTVTVTIASGPSGAALGGTQSVAAVDGVAAFTDLSLDKAGKYTLEVTDGTLTPATLAGFTVDFVPTTTTLQTSTPTAAAGTSVTFTATVASTSRPTPTGNVTFFDGATPIGSAALDSSGVAVLADAALSVGSHSITAIYTGDGACAASTSASITQTVTPLAASQPAYTLLTEVVSTGQPKTRVPVVVTSDGSAFKGDVTINLYADAGTTLDGNQVLVTSMTRMLSLKATASTAVNFNIKSLPPTLAQGTYHLLGELVDRSVGSTRMGPAPTVQLAAPFIQPAVSVGAVIPASIASGKSGSILITVSNNGNVAATGVAITLSPSETGATPMSGVSFETIHSGATIQPHKSKTFKLHFKVTSTLAAGSYFPFVSATLGGVSTTMAGGVAFTVG